MGDCLKIGDTLRTLAGIEIKVQKCMSEDGGQGRVYAVDYGGTQKVLKWYKKSFLVTLSQRIVRYDRNGRAKGFEDPDLADDVRKNALEAFYGNLCYNAKNKPKPSSLGNKFVWPIDVVINGNSNTGSYFGYVMDYIDTKSYGELNKFYNFNVRFASRYVMLTCCLNIAEAFRKLHSCGFSYQDLSGGNIYAHPQTGDIRIADNDNVATNGENYGIGGTEGYMAPEVLSGYTPDKYTDRFSLAVILFRIMMGGQHPFKGKYSQETDDNMIAFCKDPVFIFDDIDKRNAPEPIRHKNAMILWSQYPSYIHDLFKRAFKTKMVEKELDRINPKTGNKMHVFVDTNRTSRPLEEEWIRALLRLRGEMIDCAKCREPVFLNLANTVRCPKCKTEFKVPCKVKCGNAQIPIVPGSVIHHCQIDTGYREDFNKSLMRLVASAGQYMFENMTGGTWRVDYPDGRCVTVPSRGNAPFKLGMKIHIGTYCLEITR